jgi:hypothetical protein
MLPDTGERYLSTPLFEPFGADMNEEELAISRSTPGYQMESTQHGIELRGFDELARVNELHVAGPTGSGISAVAGLGIGITATADQRTRDERERHEFLFHGSSLLQVGGAVGGVTLINVVLFPVTRP